MCPFGPLTLLSPGPILLPLTFDAPVLFVGSLRIEAHSIKNSFLLPAGFLALALMLCCLAPSLHFGRGRGIPVIEQTSTTDDGQKQDERTHLKSVPPTTVGPQVAPRRPRHPPT